MVTSAIRDTPDASIAYRQRADDVIAALQSNARRGLSSAEAAARLARAGRNELASEPPIPAWRRFVAQFQDVLVILLLIATAVSAVLWVYEREAALPYEAIAILAVVLLNATMGYIQESRAEAAVAALRSAGIYDQVQSKLVLGENISQAAQFADSGSADVGVIALALALSPALKKSGTYFEVPVSWHPAIEQGAVVLASSHQKGLAHQFIEHLKKPDIVRMLAAYGFAVPQIAR